MKGIGDSDSVEALKEIKKTTFGPALPPHLVIKKSNNSSHKDIIGPPLPPYISQSVNSISDQGNQEKIIGPALPPHLAKDSEKKVENLTEPSKLIGPCIPPGFTKNVPSTIDSCLHSVSSINEQTSSESTKIQSNESDEEAYGPWPVDNHKLSSSHLALEERALQLKIDKLDPKLAEPSREDWMLKLPEQKVAHFGLGPRQFRKRAGPDLSDRSVWTVIQGKSSNESQTEKIDLSKEAELKEIVKRDQEQEVLSRKYKKKEKSLLEMHTNKVNQQKKEGASNERRPFSREVDLQVNRFDEVQKKAILKKAQHLDDRFSSGQSKFL
ncbi:GPALPP motifs-containing protein 1 [Cylas formicarius]|uniref:GPALPP motifs-containing protein 1 n=1 Tax=Cylas formicarius TaxID=197179 RepID=UPI002958DB31|nr:GPALPP motifs-containing protein 1 [Cylas formicarius]XP_060536242.1 GPALPP motifs-containing protein 1 [Cylas formicarius]